MKKPLKGSKSGKINNYCILGNPILCCFYLCFFPNTVFLNPVLSSFGGVAGIVNGIVEVVEGSDLTLSCDGNPNNTVNPRYQWFNDSGNSLTVIANSPPHNLVLNDISRDESGQYVCRNTFSGNNEVRMTSVTVNVLCK